MIIRRENGKKPWLPAILYFYNLPAAGVHALQSTDKRTGCAVEPDCDSACYRFALNARL